MNDYNIIQRKSLTEGAVKDVDIKSRTVSGYFSSFGTKDSDNDIIVKGAFKKSIQEQGSEGKDLIFHLHQHDPNQVLGKPKTLIEDDFGLYFETEIVDTTFGLNVLKLYDAGVYKQHSIGFFNIKDKFDHDEETNTTTIREVKLFEGSTVTWGANENTPFAGFKGTKTEYITELKKDLDYYMKAAKVGNLTDEMYRKFEITIANILKDLNTISKEPLLDNTSDSAIDANHEESKGIDYQYIINQLKSKENGGN